ncbi:MAG TPA: hypothetical protein VJO35_18700 [Terriglobales bacterium]|nr:hypothetical protein [Terriglobales bacterium]
MDVRNAVSGLAVIVTLAFSHVLAQPVSSTESRSGAVPIFEISADDSGKVLSIDPVVILTGKKFTPVPDACAESHDLLQFEKKYLYVGARYSLIFGGRAVGIVRVMGLNGPDWQVNADSSIKLKDLTMALAVAGLPLPKGISKRRKPTTAQVERAKRLAAKVFQEHDAPASLVTNVSISQISLVDLHGVPQLFVAAEIPLADGGGIDYSLSFLADLAGGVKSILWFQHSPGEAEAEALYLIDQLDIDEDGIDELFLRRVFYENYRYEIYKHNPNGWEKVFATQILGCE